MEFEDVAEEELSIICGPRTPEPIIAWLVVALAIGLCIWATIRTWRSDDPRRKDSVLLLLRQSALIALLLGTVSFLMQVISMLTMTAAMAGAIHVADLAAWSSIALVPVVMTVAAATLILIVRTVLEYVHCRHPLPAGSASGN